MVQQSTAPAGSDTTDKTLSFRGKRPPSSEGSRKPTIKPSSASKHQRALLNRSQTPSTKTSVQSVPKPLQSARKTQRPSKLSDLAKGKQVYLDHLSESLYDTFMSSDHPQELAKWLEKSMSRISAGLDLDSKEPGRAASKAMRDQNSNLRAELCKAGSSGLPAVTFYGSVGLVLEMDKGSHDQSELGIVVDLFGSKIVISETCERQSWPNETAQKLINQLFDEKRKRSQGPSSEGPAVQSEEAEGEDTQTEHTEAELLDE